MQKYPIKIIILSIISMPQSEEYTLQNRISYFDNNELFVTLLT